MVQSSIDLDVWKEIAISKQILIKTATDALGLDPECTEDELELALNQGIKQITEAESLVSVANEANQAAIASIEQKLQSSEESRLKTESVNKKLQVTQLELDLLIKSTRKQSAEEVKKTAVQLEEKTKALKKIKTTLADSPENVVKKLKALNKKKLDETNARKRAEDEARIQKKAKQKLQKNVDELETTLSDSTKLVELYRELRAFCEEQYTQLKDLVEDDALTSLPDSNEDLLKSLHSEESKEDEKDDKKDAKKDKSNKQK